MLRCKIGWHNWSRWWLVESDGHYERLCFRCGAVKIRLATLKEEK